MKCVHPSRLPCSAGTWQNQSGQPSCMDADPGYYVDTNASIIQTPCSAGTWQNQSGQPSCMDADPGYYVDSGASPTQSPCPSGTYNPQSGSIVYGVPGRGPGVLRGLARVRKPDSLLRGDVAEPVRSTLVHGRGSDTTWTRPRPQARLLFGGDVAEPVRSTSRMDATQDITSIRMCPSSRLLALLGPTSRPMARYHASEADSGHYVPSDSSENQVPCSPGSFQPNTGQASCLDADPGHYVDSNASTSQTECGLGTYRRPRGRHRA